MALLVKFDVRFNFDFGKSIDFVCQSEEYEAPCTELSYSTSLNFLREVNSKRGRCTVAIFQTSGSSSPPNVKTLNVPQSKTCTPPE